MKVDAFDFHLPRKLIASRPVVPRDAARLLVVGEGLEDRRISDLPRLLDPGDIVVFNDTRVIPARLHGRRGSAGIEVTLHRERRSAVWDCFARPAKRLRPGDVIAFAADLSAVVLGKGPRGEVTLDFGVGSKALIKALRCHGAMPLPPYITRQRPADARDMSDYQTMFAARDGAVAAPTAALHFTPALVDRLAVRGIRHAALTLHVGAGTFLPVTVGDTDGHRMYPERAIISASAAAAVNRARDEGGRLVAVGTTTLRLLETAADDDGRVHPFEGETQLFITPGYRFKSAELLLTNFHLPRSTLFMLVCAFAGTERMHAAYRHAKNVGYRFYTYGDCSLLHRAGK